MLQISVYNIKNVLLSGEGIIKEREWKRKKTRFRPRERPKKRKNDNGQDKKKENTLSTKKVTKKF